MTANLRWAFILVTSLFFMWGLSYGLLDVLNKHFQETLHVTKAQSGLLQAAYFGAYFLVALPAGYFMDRKGYKAGILVGLCLYALGALLFVPAASANSFGVFLFALFVIASGLGCLKRPLTRTPRCWATRRAPNGGSTWPSRSTASGSLSAR